MLRSRSDRAAAPKAKKRLLFAEQRIELLDRFAGRLLLVLMPVLLVGGIVGKTFLEAPPFLNPEAADYAQIARHIARGDGFSTSRVSPIVAGLGFGLSNAPELTRAPLYPYTLAALFRTKGYSDKMAIAWSVAGLLLCLAFVFGIGWRVFDWQTGLLALALILFNSRLLPLGVGGVNTSWAAALTAGAFFACTFVRKGQDAGSDAKAVSSATWLVVLVAFVTGGLFGLAYLTEYALFIVLLPLVWHIRTLARPKQRLLVAALLLCGFLVVAMPWWLKSLRTWGGPMVTLDRYAAMLGSEQYPGTTMYRVMAAPEDPYLFLLRHPRAALTNLFRTGAGLYGALPFAVGPLIVIGVALLYLTPLRSTEDEVWRRTLLYSLGAVVVATAFTLPFTELNYLPLLPLAAILAALGYVRLLRRLSMWHGWTVFSLLIVLLLVPFSMAQDDSASASLRPTIANLQSLARVVPPDVVVATDVPALVTWYLDRPAVWLPAGPEDFEQAVAKSPGPIVLFLSRDLAKWPAREGAENYQRLLFSPRLPRGFQEVRLLYSGDRLLIPGPGDSEAPERAAP